MILKLFSSQAMLGLDIYDHALRLIKLQKKKKQITTELMLAKALPTDLVQNGKIIKWDALTNLLRAIVQAHKLQGYHVVGHIPASLLKLRELYLPKGLSKTAMLAEILRELKQDFSEHESPAFDYLTIKTENAYQHVLCAALQQTYLQEYIQFIQTAGLKINRIEIDVYALARFAQRFVESKDENKKILMYGCFVLQTQTYLIAFYPHYVFKYTSWDSNVEIDATLQSTLQNWLCTFNSDQPQLIIFAEAVKRLAIERIASALRLTHRSVTTETLTIANSDPNFYLAASLGLRGCDA